MNYERSWIRLPNLQKECLQTATESYLTHMFEQTNLCAQHAKRVTGKTPKISYRNGIIRKKYGASVKIIFSHAERFKSCKTTTRNEYLKSIFCLYSTHSIYPEIKFQIHFLFVCHYYAYNWHIHLALQYCTQIVHNNCNQGIAGTSYIFVCWCRFISHENKLNINVNSRLNIKMGNRSQREILIENQIYLAGLDKDGFQVGLFHRNLWTRQG